MTTKTSFLLLFSLLAGCASPTPTNESATAGASSELEASTPASDGSHDRGDYRTRLDGDGRLWVYAPGEELAFPDKHVSLVGAGPGGRTLRASSKDVALGYLAARTGFDTEVVDGRVWVWEEGAEHERPEKHTTLVGAGPRGMTVKAESKDLALAYVAAKDGFDVKVVDGRLWVWPAGSEKAMPDKHVTLVGAGPRGMTVKAETKDHAVAYLAAVPGFDVEVDEGRLWVWRTGDEREKSEKHATMVGAGPRGMTVKAADLETARAYAASFQR